MRNTGMEAVGMLVGDWALTISDAWFLDPPGTEVPGSATVEWFGEAFLLVHSVMEGGETTLAIGRSDANDAYKVLYHDDRGVCRLFAMTWDGDRWTMSREDPDFHQRFIADVEPDRISGRWEASEDQGQTWRKDFDLTFTRRSQG